MPLNLIVQAYNHKHALHILKKRLGLQKMAINFFEIGNSLENIVIKEIDQKA